jgi:Zn-dependent protease with chaperone function
VITFKGTYFDGKSSEAHEVTATAQGNVLSIRGEGVHADFNIDSCTVEPALGSTRRTLHTSGDGRLDTEDHKAFLALERNKGGIGGFRIVHLLESRWKAALAAAAVAVLAILAAAVWGIPYLAEKAAFSLPDKALQTLGKGALDSVDRHLFKPSELDAEEHERIRSLVETFATETGAPQPRALVFRKSPFGPNAFALPGDTVVLTDELVSFVEGDDELLGIVAHELAHLRQRHAVRTLLQGTGVFLLVSVLVGDVTSITSAAGTLPALLLESSYSRGFEQEADSVATRWMHDVGYGVEPMIAFLTRVKEKKHGVEGPEFLSTHPALDKRIAYLRSLEEGRQDTETR